jgi:hypothetical protein
MSNIFEKMVEKDPIKYPARMGKKWEDDEVVKLLRSIQKKKSISDIATEHQRTIGAINAERRKLAADYWFHDKRPIEEIIKFTGLTKEEIEDTIKRRTAAREFKAKQTVTEDLVEIPSDMKEVIILLKDIQSKLSFLMEKVQ